MKPKDLVDIVWDPEDVEYVTIQEFVDDPDDILEGLRIQLFVVAQDYDEENNTFLDPWEDMWDIFVEFDEDTRTIEDAWLYDPEDNGLQKLYDNLESEYSKLPEEVSDYLMRTFLEKIQEAVTWYCARRVGKERKDILDI
jgi:hypothetical protein